MNNLAVSYMGKPLHFLASVVWALLSRFLSLFLGAKRRAAGDQGASFNKPVSPLPRQPLVRLKNLPQVSRYVKSVPLYRVPEWEVAERASGTRHVLLFRVQLNAPRYIRVNSPFPSSFIRPTLCPVVPGDGRDRRAPGLSDVSPRGVPQACGRCSRRESSHDPLYSCLVWSLALRSLLTFLLAPQSEEYFINTRGNVIHFRSYLPQSADAIKAVVLFSHGYELSQDHTC